MPKLGTCCLTFAKFHAKVSQAKFAKVSRTQSCNLLSRCPKDLSRGFLADDFQNYSSVVEFWVALWVALLLARRSFSFVFVRLGPLFLLWSLVPWGLSLLPTPRPGVPLAPLVAFLFGFWPLWGCPALAPLLSPVLWSPGASVWPWVAFAPLGYPRSRLSYRHKLCRLDECPIGFTAYRFLTLVSAPSSRVTCFTLADKITVAKQFFA